MVLLNLNQGNNYASFWGNAATTAQSPMSDAAIQEQLTFRGEQVNRSREAWWSAMPKYLLAAPPRVLDSIAAIVPGVERGDVETMLYTPFPDAARWVRGNTEGVEIAGGLMGAVATAAAAEVGAAKLLANGWFAATGVGKFVVPIVARVEQAKLAAQSATAIAAEAGTSLGIGFNANGTYIAYAAASGVAKAAVGEAAIALTMNQNTAVWDDDAKINAIYAALGIGIGGALGTIAGRAGVLGFANSKAITEISANAIDPAGYQLSRLKAAGATVRGAEVFPKQSSVVANLFLDARRLIDESSPAAASQRAMAVQTETEAQRQLQVLTSHGSPNLLGSQFNVKGSGEGKAILEAAHDDPSSLLGLSSVSRVPERMTVAELLVKRIQVLRTLPRKQRMARLKETPLVLQDGSWIPAADSLDIGGFKPGATSYKVTTSGDVTWRTQNTKLERSLRLDGRLHVAWERLSDIHRVEARDAMNLVITRAVRRSDRTPFRMPIKPTYIEMDLAAEIIDRGGKVSFENAAVKSIEELRLASLRQKAAYLSKSQGAITPRTRFMLNLPQATAMERIADPESVGLRQLMLAATQADATTGELLKARKVIARTLMLSDQEVKPRLDGNFFNFNLTREGTWKPPVVGFFEERPVSLYTKETLDTSIAAGKIEQVSFFKSQPKNTLIRELTDTVYALDTSVRDVLDVRGLANNQVAYLRNSGSNFAGQFLTQEFKARYQKQLLAAQKIRAAATKVGENFVSDSMHRLRNTVEPVTDLSVKSKRSAALFSAYRSFAGGWDIKRVVDLGDGMTGFELSTTSKSNIERLGRAVNKGELLTSPVTKRPVALDKAANDLRLAIEYETTQLLKENNRLRIAQGKAPIKGKDFYVAPPKTDNKLVGYVLDANNNLVSGKAIIADTKAEFVAARNALKLDKNERFLSVAEFQAHADLWQQLEMDFVDPTKLAAKRGHGAGKLRSETVNPRALNDALANIKDSYEQITNGWVRVTFAPQIKHALMREAAEANLAGGLKSPTSTIYRDFVERLLGIPAHSDPKGVNKVLKSTEEITDQVLEEWSPALNAPKRLVADLFNKVGQKVTKKKLDMTFTELTKELGPHTPFAQIDDMLAYESKKLPEWRTREVIRKGQQFATGAILRWGETSHAMMNLAGLMVNMPAIVGQSTVPLLGKVGKDGVGIIDTAKIINSGMKRMMAPGKRTTRDWDYMVKMGYITQPVADMYKAFAATENRNGVMRLLLGDPRYDNYRSINNPTKRASAMLKAKGIEGMLGVITDTSEDWSRQYAHFVGLELADHVGLTRLSERHAFANDIANQAIANYSPMNRPEIYQTAFGSSYGLFLSYAQQFYQRMYRWIEVKDYKAAASNLGLQGALFGLTGIPLFEQVSNLLGGDRKSDSVLDNVYSAYGAETGSVIANGSFNQLSTLLGLPAMGINTRGSMSVRHPALTSLSLGSIAQPAALEVLTKMAGGVIDIVGKTIDPNVPMSGRHAAEILARTLPSRVLKGAITNLALGGQEADAYGNVMAETQNWAESLFRYMGIRSQRQGLELEQYFANKTALAQDAQRLSYLREATRALVRSQEFDRLPEVFKDYLAAGGKPWNYTDWIRGIVTEATRTRTENQFLKSLNSPSHRELAGRIAAYTEIQ